MGDVVEMIENRSNEDGEVNKLEFDWLILTF
jgi:hypothetical protein